MDGEAQRAFAFLKGGMRALHLAFGDLVQQRLALARSGWLRGLRMGMRRSHAKDFLEVSGLGKFRLPGEP